MVIYSKNPIKYNGSLIKQKKRYIFCVTEDKKRKVVKEFIISNYESIDKLKEEANKFKIQWGIDNNKTANSYTIIENSHLVVNVNNNKSFLADLSDLEIVEKYIWKIQNGSCYITALLPKNERKDAKMREYSPFHKVKLGTELINHINNNKLDNRSSNLKKTTINKHRWKIQHCNKKKRSDNTSGNTGIYKGSYKGYEYWQVRGVDYNNNTVNKKYGIRKWGDEGAKAMAEKYRNDFIDESYKLYTSNIIDKTAKKL